jgi:hypothetical protein
MGKRRAAPRRRIAGGRTNSHAWLGEVPGLAGRVQTPGQVPPPRGVPPQAATRRLHHPLADLLRPVPSPAPPRLRLGANPTRGRLVLQPPTVG